MKTAYVKHARLFSILLLGGLFFATSLAAQTSDPPPTTTDNITPTKYSGNPNCTDLGYTYGFKIDGWVKGDNLDFTFEDGSQHGYPTELIGGASPLSETVTISSDGAWFDWTSTLGIDAVIVKGSDAADTYVYEPPTEDFGDTDLHPPMKTSTEPFDISHIEFCYDLDPPPTGKLEVVKVLEPASDLGKFDLQIDGVTDPDADDVGGGGSTGEETVTVGNHTVGEAAGTGTNLADYAASIECRDNNGAGSIVASASNAGPLTVPVNANDDIVCTITNIREGVIMVEKQTDPDGAPDSFAFTGDASGAIKDGEQIVVSGLVPGAYTSQETVPAGWELTNIVCDDTNSTVSLAHSRANFQVEAGETVTCTFFNRKEPPPTGTIIIEKVTDPAGAPEQFYFTGELGDFSLSDGESVTYPDVQAGAYDVTELLPVGWLLDGITCVDPDGGTTVDGSTVSIDLDPNETVTCIFANTADGGVTIGKTQSAGATVEPGEIFTYTLSLQNRFENAVKLMVTDALSAYVDYVGGTLEVFEGATLMSVDDTDFDDRNFLEYTTDTLDYLEFLTISFDVEVDALAEAGTIIENFAEVFVFYPGTDIEIDYEKSNEVRTEVIPEPGTVVFFGIGLIGVLALLRRRRSSRN